MDFFGKTPEQAGRIHFIGAGGIGMSGLVTLLHQAGFFVQGSDLKQNDNVMRLQAAGIEIFLGHKEQHVAGVSCVVCTSAIKKDNPELLAAKAQNVPILHRADVLAEIMSHYRSIAVAGTHGKTSTTALIWSALQAAGVDAGLINGGFVQSIQDVVQLPKTPGGWLVVEADESDRSFLKLPHTFAVVLNIEPEHMENYDHDTSQLYRDFANFLAMSRQPEKNIVYGQGLPDALYAEGPTTYGVQGSDFACASVRRQGWQTFFDLPQLALTDVILNLPGVHYAENATAALAVVAALGADVDAATEGLASFTGVGRRFTRVGHFNGAVVVDDYAHHPTEIEATVLAARDLTDGQLIAVFEPHKYTRLADLMDRFATSTHQADKTFVLPVYSAGEDPLDGISSAALVEKMEGAVFVENETALRQALASEVQEGDTILVMGAGTSSAIAQRLGE